MRPYKIRLLVLGILALSAASGTMSYASVEKYETMDALQEALDDASSTYNAGRGLFWVKEQRQKEVEKAEAVLEEVSREKSRIRRKIAAVQKEVKVLKEDYGIDVTNSGAILAMVEQEKDNFATFVRYLQARDLFSNVTIGDLGVVIVRRMLTASLGDVTDLRLRDRAVERAKLRMFKVVIRASQISEEAEELKAQHQDLLGQYEVAWDDVRDAKDAVQAAETRIAAAKRMVEEVHAQVLRLQSQLARIDAQLREESRRELIEKGLMDADPNSRSDGANRSAQSFIWPVRGRITATFMSESYQRFFGIPHRGMDIAAPQGSPIYAADDGIVFLARNGGATGYSYILIGHRNGYATLYGHLSSFAVSNGEQVRKGQAVGLSGGTPGTHGAGPTTTGPHLHFEVIQNGVNINPAGVLN